MGLTLCLLLAINLGVACAQNAQRIGNPCTVTQAEKVCML